MKEISARNFGLLISNLLPGLVALWGVSHFSSTVRTWLGTAPPDSPTIGGFLYVTLASLAAGMTVSAVRFHLIDRIHHLTGIRQPDWDFSRLTDNVAAYGLLIDIHYHYYQFYANMLVALAFSYGCHRLSSPSFGFGWIDLSSLFVAIIYFATSRDNLRKYYARVAKLLGEGQGKPHHRILRLRHQLGH
jgi:hypothetical protein